MLPWSWTFTLASSRTRLFSSANNFSVLSIDSRKSKKRTHWLANMTIQLYDDYCIQPAYHTYPYNPNFWFLWKETSLLQGSYRQDLITFKYFSSTVLPIFKDYSFTKYLHFYACAITRKVQPTFNEGENTNRNVQTFALSNFELRNNAKIWNTMCKSLDIYFKSPILVVLWKTRSPYDDRQKILKFKYFSRKLWQWFISTFKTKFILKDLSRHPLIFKYFSSLCKPCLIPWTRLWHCYSIYWLVSFTKAGYCSYAQVITDVQFYNKTYRIRPTAHTPISAQSSNSVVFRLQSVQFCLLLYKGIYCGYPSELHSLVDTIQMSTNNICFCKENQKENWINIVK